MKRCAAVLLLALACCGCKFGVTPIMVVIGQPVIYLAPHNETHSTQTGNLYLDGPDLPRGEPVLRVPGRAPVPVPETPAPDAPEAPAMKKWTPL